MSFTYRNPDEIRTSAVLVGDSEFIRRKVGEWATRVVEQLQGLFARVGDGSDDLEVADVHY